MRISKCHTKFCWLWLICSWQGLHGHVHCTVTVIFVYTRSSSSLCMQAELNLFLPAKASSLSILLSLQVMILYGGVYEFCMWLYYDASDHWVYQTTDWRTDKPVLVYILLPVAYVALFFLWYVLPHAFVALLFVCYALASFLLLHLHTFAKQGRAVQILLTETLPAVSSLLSDVQCTG